MKNAICTIITQDYQHYALGLLDSIVESGFEDFEFHVFISSKRPETTLIHHPAKINFFFIEDLCTNGLGKRVFDQYFRDDMDKFRWCMKSVLVAHLLETKHCDKVLYVDGDINFFSSPKFLFDDLDKYSVLLTPHFRSSWAKDDIENYLSLFTRGIFNAGFIAANSRGIEAMNWWGENCLILCTKNDCKGQFDDQTHLNLLPVYFEDVHILKHRGCNLAAWNLNECRRGLDEFNRIKINGLFDVVFVHFTATTVRNIRFGNDRLLDPLLTMYIDRLVRYKPDFRHPAIQKYLENKAKKHEKPGLSERAVSKLKRLLKK